MRNYVLHSVPTRLLLGSYGSFYKVGPRESESHHLLIVLLPWSPGPKFRAMDQV